MDSLELSLKVAHRTSDISHQVFRLRKIADLQFAILGYVGNILDTAKDEFIHTANDLKINYSIIDVIDFARLAVIGGLLCPRDANKIENGKCNCGYRVRGNLLNFLQIDAIKRLEESHKLNQKSGVIILPTGTGKTRVAAVDSKNISAHKILYIAHTHEILDNAEKEFSHIYGSEKVVRLSLQSKSKPKANIFLNTIQSVKNRLSRISSLNFDYVVIDEFHHAAASSYKKLLQVINPKFLLGLTATPFRGDRQDVIELCDGNVIVNYELRTAIDGGILSPFNYYGLFDDIDYSNLHQYSYGYSIKDLNKALIIDTRDNAIISKWKELANDLPSLAFCCSIPHAKRMERSLIENGIPAASYLGDTPLEKRESLIESLRFGELKVLCVVDVLNEGVDIPFIECLLFLRPTESKRIFFQQLGRGLRKFPGKEKVIVLDFIGNFANAYRIVDYVGILPDEDPTYKDLRKIKTAKDVLNLPLGCIVNFDDRVIDIFATQVFDPSHATRFNIAQILIYEYLKLCKRLNMLATKKEVDRYQILNSELYEMVFGSWRNFDYLTREDPMFVEYQ